MSNDLEEEDLEDLEEKENIDKKLKKKKKQKIHKPNILTSKLDLIVLPKIQELPTLNIVHLIPCYKCIVVSYNIINTENFTYNIYLNDILQKTTAKTTIALYNLEFKLYNLTIIATRNQEAYTIKTSFTTLSKLSKTCKNYGYYHANNLYQDLPCPTEWTTTNQITLMNSICDDVLKTDTNMIVDTRWIFFGGPLGQFDTNWEKNWLQVKSKLIYYIHKITSFYLDEPFWALQLSSETLQKWADIIKQDFPNTPLLIILAYPLIIDGPDKYKDKVVPYGNITIPKNIDYIGYDQYDVTQEQIYNNHTIMQNIAKCSNNQKIFVISQGYQLDKTKSVLQLDSENLMNNANYFNLCNANEEIIGNLVFTYNFIENCLGSKNLEDTYEFQQFVGKLIKNNI
jgi:hypothetical protein